MAIQKWETAETQAAGSSSQQATTLSPTSLLSQLRSPTQSELTRKRKVRVLTNRPTPAREKRSQLAQFNEQNLSIIGTFIEHNRYIFGAVQHSIIGRFWSIQCNRLRPTWERGCVLQRLHNIFSRYCFLLLVVWWWWFWPDSLCCPYMAGTEIPLYPKITPEKCVILERILQGEIYIAKNCFVNRILVLDIVVRMALLDPDTPPIHGKNSCAL